MRTHGISVVYATIWAIVTLMITVVHTRENGVYYNGVQSPYLAGPRAERQIDVGTDGTRSNEHTATTTYEDTPSSSSTIILPSKRPDGVRVRGRYRLSPDLDDDGQPVFLAEDFTTPVHGLAPVYDDNDHRQRFDAGCIAIAKNIIKIGFTADISDVYCVYRCNFTVPERQANCTASSDQHTVRLPKFIERLFSSSVREINNAKERSVEDAIAFAFSDEDGLGVEDAIANEATMSRGMYRQSLALFFKFPHHVITAIALFAFAVLVGRNGTTRIPLGRSSSLPIDYNFGFRVSLAFVVLLICGGYAADVVPSYAAAVNSATVLAAALTFGLGNDGRSGQYYAAMIMFIVFGFYGSIMLPDDSAWWLETIVILITVLAVFYGFKNVFSTRGNTETINLVFLMEMIVMTYDFGSYLFTVGHMTPAVAFMRLLATGLLPIGHSSRYTLYINHLNIACKQGSIIIHSMFPGLTKSFVYFMLLVLFIFGFVMIRVGLEYSRTRANRRTYTPGLIGGLFFYYLGDLLAPVRFAYILLNMLLYSSKPATRDDVNALTMDALLTALTYLEWVFARDVFYVRIAATVVAVFAPRYGPYELVKDYIQLSDCNDMLTCTIGISHLVSFSDDNSRLMIAANDDKDDRVLTMANKAWSNDIVRADNNCDGTLCANNDDAVRDGSIVLSKKGELFKGISTTRI